MKKLILVSCLALISALTHAQGLDSIIVERYYVSDANDTSVNASGGILPVSSVTYRVYVDMATGYKFQAAYGVPSHECRIATSTLFFNNEDRGATTPTYTKSQAKNNTIMLDSWLSVGSACSGNYGVLKTEDNGVSTIVNAEAPPVVQNASPLAGIPITAEDGLLAGTPPSVTFVGISASEFDNQNDGTNGPVFSTFNGSWASLSGTVGPTVDNRVLIGQFTTDGTFSFELNIQLGTPTPGGVEQYVAKNPVGSEIQNSTLTFTSASSGVGIPTINTNSSKTIVNVYPNPTNGNVVKLEVVPTKVSENNSYKIYDIIGNVVSSKIIGKVNSKFIENVDLSNLKAGQYFIELSLDGTKSTKKIVKY